MRGFHRVVYSILMPILFVVFLALAMKFTMTVDIANSVASGAPDAEFNMEQIVTTVVTVSIKDAIPFRLDNLKFIAETHSSVSAISGAITPGATTTSFELGTVARALLPVLGILACLVGCIFCCIGYGSKFLTILGFLLLGGATVVSFLSPGFSGEAFYHIIETSGDSVKDVINVSLPGFLNSRLILFVIDGISLLNLIFVLSKKNAIQL